MENSSIAASKAAPMQIDSRKRSGIDEPSTFSAALHYQQSHANIAPVNSMQQQKSSHHQQSAGVMLGVPLQVFSMEGQFFRREARSKKDLDFMKASLQQNSHLMSLHQSQAEQGAINESSLLLYPSNKSMNSSSLAKREQIQNSRSNHHRQNQKHLITAIVNVRSLSNKASKFKHKQAIASSRTSQHNLNQVGQIIVVPQQLEHNSRQPSQNRDRESIETNRIDDRQKVGEARQNAPSELSTSPNNRRLNTEVVQIVDQPVANRGDKQFEQRKHQAELHHNQYDQNQNHHHALQRMETQVRPRAKNAEHITPSKYGIFKAREAAAEPVIGVGALQGSAAAAQSRGMLHDGVLQTHSTVQENRDLVDVLTSNKKTTQSLVSTEMLDEELLMSQEIKAALLEPEPTRIVIFEKSSTKGQKQHVQNPSNVSTLIGSRKYSVNNHENVTNRSDNNINNASRLGSQSLDNGENQKKAAKSPSWIKQNNNDRLRNRHQTQEDLTTKFDDHAANNLNQYQASNMNTNNTSGGHEMVMQSEVLEPRKGRGGILEPLKSESMIIETPMDPKINATSLIDAASDTRRSLFSNNRNNNNDWSKVAMQAQENNQPTTVQQQNTSTQNNDGLLKKVQKKSVAVGTASYPKTNIANLPKQRKKKTSLFGQNTKSFSGHYGGGAGGGGKIKVSQGTQMIKEEMMESAEDYKVRKPLNQKLKTVKISKSSTMIKGTNKEHQDFYQHPSQFTINSTKQLKNNNLNENSFQGGKNSEDNINTNNLPQTFETKNSCSCPSNDSDQHLLQHSVPVLHHRLQAQAIQNTLNPNIQQYHQHQSAKHQLSQVLKSHHHQRSTALLPTKSFLNKNAPQSMDNLSRYQLRTTASEKQYYYEQQENISDLLQQQSPPKEQKRLLAQEQQAQYYQRIIHHKNSLINKHHLLQPQQMADYQNHHSNHASNSNNQYMNYQYSSCQVSTSRRRIHTNLKYESSSQPKTSMRKLQSSLQQQQQQQQQQNQLSNQQQWSHHNRLMLKRKLQAQKSSFQNELIKFQTMADKYGIATEPKTHESKAAKAAAKTTFMEYNNNNSNISNNQPMSHHLSHQDQQSSPERIGKRNDNGLLQTHLPSGIDLEKVRIVMSERRNHTADSHSCKDSVEESDKRRRMIHTVVMNDGQQLSAYEDSRQQVHTLKNDSTNKNCLSIVISSQNDKSDPELIVENLVTEESSKQKQSRQPVWQDLVRDEFSLIKCPLNAFGSKGYKLGMDKSALSQHVVSILKANLLGQQELTSLPKPYLIKQQKPSVSEQSLQNQKFQKYKDTISQNNKHDQSFLHSQDSSAALSLDESVLQTSQHLGGKQENNKEQLMQKQHQTDAVRILTTNMNENKAIVNPIPKQQAKQLQQQSTSSQHRCNRNHERRYYLSSNRADKLTKSTGQRSYDYKTRGSQYRSRIEPIESSSLEEPNDNKMSNNNHNHHNHHHHNLDNYHQLFRAAGGSSKNNQQLQNQQQQQQLLTTHINPTTMAQWQRHCSPEAIQAQIMKLQALRIDKLNIDYKLVDRSNDERPYMVSEDEKEEEYDYDENDQGRDDDVDYGNDEHDGVREQDLQQQEQRNHHLLQNSSGTTPHQDGDEQHHQQDASVEIDWDTSVANKKYKSHTTAVDTTTTSRVAAKNLNTDKSLFSSNVTKDQGRNTTTSASIFLPKAAVEATSFQQQQQLQHSSKEAAQPATGTSAAESTGVRCKKGHGGGLSRRHMRNKLPKSPTLSLLKQVPSDHFLKLSTLMKKAQQCDPNQQQHQQQFGQIAKYNTQKTAEMRQGELEYQGGQPLTLAGQMYLSRRGVGPEELTNLRQNQHQQTTTTSTSGFDPMSKKKRYGEDLAMLVHVNSKSSPFDNNDIAKEMKKPSQRRHARNQEMKLLRTTETKNTSNNLASNLDSLLELYKVPSSTTNELDGNLKKSFRSYNNHHHHHHNQIKSSGLQHQPLGQQQSQQSLKNTNQFTTAQLHTNNTNTGKSSSRLATKNKLSQQQFTKSTQLVRDASVKFIDNGGGTNNNNCNYYDVTPEGKADLSRELQYNSIKIVSKPKHQQQQQCQLHRQSPRAAHNHHPGPGAAAFELLQVASHPTDYGAQTVVRQSRSGNLAKEGQHSQRSNQGTGRVILFDNHHIGGMQQSVQVANEQEFNSHAMASVKRGSPEVPEAGFDPIKQQNFTPGLELEQKAIMARALNAKSPKRFYQVQRQNRQVQNAYFPQL